MHGRLEAIARLSHFAQRLRAASEAEGCTTLLWDAGDAEDRSIRICSISKGAGFQGIMNAMGYTLTVVGNSVSLPYGPQAMTGVAARARFPILAANLRDGGQPPPQGIRESAIVPLPGGLRMGVIGLTAPWGDAYVTFGLRMPDFVHVARELALALRSEGAAPIALLSHLGLNDDRKVAAAVPEIDFIIGGHSHSLLPEGEVVNGVLIAQAGNYAEHLGRVDLILNPTTGVVIEKSARVLPVPADEPPDSSVLAEIAAAEAETDRLLARRVGELRKPLDLDHFGECGVGDMTADAVRERMGAECAMIATGNFHKPLPGGAVTLAHLDAACFSSANPGITSVRGSQIKAALEKGLDTEFTGQTPKALRGTPLGSPQVSGMTVEYDPGREVGNRVIRVLINSEPLQPDRVYRVAHTDVETSDFMGYMALDAGQETRYEVPTILREVMEDYIRKHSPVPLPRAGRWLRV